MLRKKIRVICLKGNGCLSRPHRTLSTTTHRVRSSRKSSTAGKMAAPTTCTLGTTGDQTPATYQGASFSPPPFFLQME